MFEQQTVNIKSGEGENRFEADATMSHRVSFDQIKVIMDGLRQMQKDRMEWAERQAK